MIDEEERTVYRVPFAPHVVGEYGPRIFDRLDRAYEPQRISIRCEKCGATHRAICLRGIPRTKVSAFALSHLHRDPLAPLPQRGPDGNDQSR